jgi:hypothetical protein
MPAERYSQPLHKVGSSFPDCQGGAHRRFGITSEQSAGTRGVVHPKGWLPSRQPHPGRVFERPGSLIGFARYMRIPPSEHFALLADSGHCHALA